MCPCLYWKISNITFFVSRGYQLYSFHLFRIFQRWMSLAHPIWAHCFCVASSIILKKTRNFNMFNRTKETSDGFKEECLFKVVQKCIKAYFQLLAKIKNTWIPCETSNQKKLNTEIFFHSMLMILLSLKIFSVGNGGVGPLFHAMDALFKNIRYWGLQKQAHESLKRARNIKYLYQSFW